MFTIQPKKVQSIQNKSYIYFHKKAIGAIAFITLCITLLNFNSLYTYIYTDFMPMHQIRKAWWRVIDI